MAIEAGSITYSIETDTSSQLKAEKVVNTSTKNIEKDLQRVDRATAKATKNATKNVGKFGRASGQAGIQFQQFIGQVQGGQNAMLALSQQSADLGFVLGAPLLGAIVGISASVAGLLAPSLLASKDNTELLEKAIEQLVMTTSEASDGTIIFSESLDKLARKSKAAAAVEIALGMQRAKEVIKLARIEVDELASSWEGFFSKNTVGLDIAISQLKRLEEVALISGETQLEVLDRLSSSYEASVTGIGGVSSAVNRLSKEYGLSSGEALIFVRALGQFKKDKSAESFENLSNVVSALATNMDKPNVKFIEMAKNINDTSLNAKDASDSMALYEEATNNVSEAISENNSETVKNAEALKTFISLLRDQAETLGFTDRQLALHAAALKGAGEVENEQINILFDAIEAHDERTEALKSEEKAIDAKSRADARAAATAERSASAEKARVSRGVSDLGLSPIQALEKRQAAQMQLLRRGLEQEEFLKQEFDVRKIELERQHQDQIMALQKKTTSEGVLNFQALETQAAGSFVQVVSGAKSSREAMSDFANTIVNQAIVGLIKMGVETVKNRILGEALERSKQAGIAATTATGITATAAGTAASVASAGTVATAAAVPAALTSTYSFGGAALAGGAALLGTLALIKGAREHGGPVSAGGSFLVGERGPEIFTPVSGGSITSNKDSFGGGTTLNVTVENNTSSNVSTQLSDDGKQLRVVINEIASQINSNQGVIPRALRQSTNTTFKTSR